MSFAASYAICRSCHLPEHVAEVPAVPLCRCREQPSAELVEERARHRREVDDLTALCTAAHAELARLRDRYEALQARVATAERERDESWREMCAAARLLEEQVARGKVTP